MKMNLSANQSK